MEIVDDFEVLIRNDLEEESKDTVGELRSTLLVGSKVWLNCVHNVQFHVQELAVNGVLRRSVEMTLHASQLDILARQMLVEKARSFGVQVVVSTHWEEESITLLIELLDSNSILLLILEHEFGIFETSMDVHARGKIDRSLLLANGADLALLWCREIEVLVGLVLLVAKDGGLREVELVVPGTRSAAVRSVRHHRDSFVCNLWITLLYRRRHSGVATSDWTFSSARLGICLSIVLSILVPWSGLWLRVVQVDRDSGTSSEFCIASFGKICWLFSGICLGLCLK